uniref:Immunoglobulin domain-containing protein n=1 Tax=Cyprinus carpio TaxID=7962 RepID=A0A8C1WTF7_CYPCA
RRKWVNNVVCLMCDINYFTVLGLYGDIIQLHPVISAYEGDNVVLPYFIKLKQITMVLWYKSQFHNEFNSNHSDAVRGTGSFNLTVMNTTQSDLGMYYCATSFANIIEFGIGTRLVIKGE